MAFDRILPARLASVAGRNSPLFAIGVYVLISLVMGWLYFFGNLASIILDQAILLTAGFAVTIVAGTVFPYLPATRQRYFDSMTLNLVPSSFSAGAFFVANRYTPVGTTTHRD